MCWFWILFFCISFSIYRLYRCLSVCTIRNHVYRLAILISEEWWYGPFNTLDPQCSSENHSTDILPVWGFNGGLCSRCSSRHHPAVAHSALKDTEELKPPWRVPALSAAAPPPPPLLRSRGETVQSSILLSITLPPLSSSQVSTTRPS